MGTPIWLSRDGITEGRIEPSGWSPPDGTWVLCLGSDVPGLTGRLEVGDYIQASQAGNFPDSTMRLRARTRGPASVPDGCWWEARLSAVWNGSANVGELVLRVDPGELLDYADIGWEVPGTSAGTLFFALVLNGPAALVAEPELPAFYIDAITFTPASAASLRLFNRFPEPGSVGARADAPVSFDAFPDSDALTVTIDGVVAYTAGAFTAPFAGPESATSTTSGGSLRFVIDPLAIWGNAATVDVVVTDGTTTIAWAFVAERTTGPELASVVAQGYQQIRVTFDETPIAVSAANGGDALNPASYAITRTPGIVSVQPTITGVTQVAANVYDLATDLELSAGAPYTLTLDGVIDLFGNATEPWSPGAVLGFNAWIPPIPAGRDFTIYDFFSDQTRADDQSGELAALCAVIQDCVDLLLYEIDSFADITNPNLAPEAYVDAMLADLGDPFTFTLTLQQKRLLVQLLLPIYEQKGTSVGIENAIRLFTGIEVDVISIGWGSLLDGLTDFLGDSSKPGWPGGVGASSFILGSTVGIDPFSFELQVVGVTPPTAAQIAIINQVVIYMMRGECNYLGIVSTLAPVPTTPVLLDGPAGMDSVLGDGSDGSSTFILH